MKVWIIKAAVPLPICEVNTVNPDDQFASEMAQEIAGDPDAWVVVDALSVADALKQYEDSK